MLVFASRSSRVSVSSPSLGPRVPASPGLRLGPACVLSRFAGGTNGADEWTSRVKVDCSVVHRRGCQHLALPVVDAAAGAAIERLNTLAVPVVTLNRLIPLATPSTWSNAIEHGIYNISTEKWPVRTDME
jgi:hypothetical protein